MSVQVRALKGKYRIVEAGSRRLFVNKRGETADNGGHFQKEDAMKQAERINRNLKREE